MTGLYWFAVAVFVMIVGLAAFDIFGAVVGMTSTTLALLLLTVYFFRNRSKRPSQPQKKELKKTLEHWYPKQ